jgi:hypothetical protein
MPCRDTRATVVLVRGCSEVASWPLRRPGPPDLALVDELARLHLTAIRMGCAIRLRDVGPSLRELLDLVGLGDVVVETGTEPEPAD